MREPAGPLISPVFVLSTGRCGSTMVSEMLNLHPRVLSLSEFFSNVGTGALLRPRTTGEQMWGWCTRQGKRTRVMLREDYPELAYPLGAPGARFDRDDLPPILCGSLPRLTSDHEALFDELEPVVRARPRQKPAAHFRDLFAWLCDRMERDAWVERSGASLLFGAQLLRAFPDARVVHIYRDGRETAISMSRHYLFRTIMATILALRSKGIDVVGSLSKGPFWDRILPWMEPLANRIVDFDKLPYDKLVLADFGFLWSGMIEHAHNVFGRLPPGRVMSVAFEKLQSEPEAELRRLIRFVSPELADDQWVREAAKLPRPPRSPSNFERLPSAELHSLTEACRPGLERLGYLD